MLARGTSRFPSLTFGAVFLAGCATVIGLNHDYSEQTTNGATGGNAGDSGSDGAGGASGSTGEADSSGGSASGGPGGADATSDAMADQEGGRVTDTGTADASRETGTLDAGKSGVRVIAGATTLAPGSPSQSVTISSVDPNHTFLVFGSQYDTSIPSASEVTGQITGKSELTFTRFNSANSPAVAIQYFAAEGNTGIRVERGSAPMTSATVTVPLANAVDLTKSFPLITFRSSGATFDYNDLVRAKLTGPSTLSLTINLPARDGVVEWQVVSFDGASVQTGDVDIGTSALSIATALASPVDRAKSWLIQSYELANVTGTAAELLIRGRTSGASELTFERDGAGATAKLTYYLVSFGGGTVVQSGTADVGAADTTAMVPLEAVDTTRSIAAAAGLYQMGGSTPYATAANTGYGVFAFDLGNGANLSIGRGASGSAAASVDWFVVAF